MIHRHQNSKIIARLPATARRFLTVGSCPLPPPGKLLPPIGSKTSRTSVTYDAVSPRRWFLQRVLRPGGLPAGEVPPGAAVFRGGTDGVQKPASVPGAGELLGDAGQQQDVPTPVEPHRQRVTAPSLPAETAVVFLGFFFSFPFKCISVL